jgi:hypothetical protein
MLLRPMQAYRASCGWVIGTHPEHIHLATSAGAREGGVEEIDRSASSGALREGRKAVASGCGIQHVCRLFT